MLQNEANLVFYRFRTSPRAISEIREEKIYLSKNTKTQIDTIYQANLQTVKVYYGTQKSDGLLPTCKSSIFDIILPLMAYLAFFCGILQLLIDSGATEKLAKFSSPLCTIKAILY
jgi:hypothetical protein